MARLSNGRYFVLHLKPGTYHIKSSLKQDALEIDAKAGKTQFPEMLILAGNWHGGGRMVPTRAGLKNLLGAVVWVLVDSTSIASIGYEPRRQELEIEFRQSGDVYLYLKIPAEEHAEFMAAESKGSSLNWVFKQKGYSYMVLRKRHN